MPDLFGLNARFGIPGQIIFKKGAGGFAVAEIHNRRAIATIALQGAHLIAWQPHGERPVIWLSAATKFTQGKAIRGGIPVCWPWFGPHVCEPSFPAHGFARTGPWEVVSVESEADDATQLLFRLIPSETTHSQWPHATPLEIRIVVGNGLAIDLITKNIGASPVTIGEALHTYFAVSDVQKIKVLGLDGCAYIDKIDSGQQKRQSGPVTFASEVDRVYLDSTSDCLIEDPGFARRIRVAKQGSRSTVVWNPWVEQAKKLGDLGEKGYLGMVCVESANAADDMVTIAPGNEHRLAVRYSVEPL